MARVAGKRKPPSRERYERGNPTVSCRVPKEVYDRLQAVKKAEDQSFADILMVGLGILEPRVKEEAVARKRAHADGYKTGYAEAERHYAVTYPCSICREMLTVTSDEEKESVRLYMQQHGWGHQECHKRGR